MKPHNDTEKDVSAKSEWSEPNVTWVKPELIRLQGGQNVLGKTYTAIVEVYAETGPS